MFSPWKKDIPLGILHLVSEFCIYFEMLWRQSKTALSISLIIDNQGRRKEESLTVCDSEPGLWKSSIFWQWQIIDRSCACWFHREIHWTYRLFNTWRNLPVHVEITQFSPPSSLSSKRCLLSVNISFLNDILHLLCSKWKGTGNTMGTLRQPRRLRMRYRELLALAICFSWKSKSVLLASRRGGPGASGRALRARKMRQILLNGQLKQRSLLPFHCSHNQPCFLAVTGTSN